MIGDLLDRLSREQQGILTVLRSLLAPECPVGPTRSVMFNDFQERLRLHFELGEKELIPRLLESTCSQARSLAAMQPARVAQLKHLLLRADALAWSRRRAAQAWEEFSTALVQHFESEERSLHDEARRHLTAGSRGSAASAGGRGPSTCHGT